MQPIDEDGHEIVGDGHYWHAWHERNRRFCFECGDLYAGFLRGNLMVTTSNLFLTARAVKTVGDFAPIRYLHDYDYIFRVMLAFPGKVHYLHDDKLLFYRIHGGNTLSQGAVVAREQDQQLIRKYMLAGVPEEVRKRAGTGADRLVELEQELFAVKSALGIHSPRWAARIASELRKRIRKLTT